MDANKIKFVDDDGSVEVLEPPMTARVHVETPTEEHSIPETIEEEPSSSSESVIIVSSASVDSSVEDLKSSVEDLKSSVEDLSGEILNLEKGDEEVKEPLNEEVVLVSRTEQKAVIEKVVEQHIKDLEKMESVILCLGSGISSSKEPLIGEPDVIKSVEVKVPDCKGGDEDKNIKAEGEPKSGALGPEEELDKESLSLVVNAVNDVRAKESAPITPKGCCILQ
jgi:hypothetical protein